MVLCLMPLPYYQYYRYTMITVKKSFKLYLMLCCTVTAFVMIWKRSRYNYHYEPMALAQNPTFLDTNSNLVSSQNFSVKYILVWTDPDIDPIIHLGEGMETVIERNCSVIQCFMSSDRRYLENVADFDAIVFHGPNINYKDLPRERSRHQKYIFASMESSNNYPICNKSFNDYFNWTWTYKLHSDEYYGYMSIRNKDRTIIGPKTEMQWMKVEEMEPIDEKLRNKLSRKKHAAAWFVSHCNTSNKRELIAFQLLRELKKYNLTLDIYGRCGEKVCPRDKMNDCLEMLTTDYYFYLSFENSLNSDYVTEKLLHALQHYTVPIVFGGANYTRFMPDGIYLDARKLSVTELAKQMADLIEDKEKYYSYFRWHNHYSYHYVEESPETDSYCKLCAMVNNKELFAKTSVYPNFIDWWNEDDTCNDI